MAEAAIKLMSVEEFLAWDDGTDTRYQLFDGRPVAMAPAGRAHSVIAGRLARAVGNALVGKPGCEVFPEIGIRSASRPRTLYVADFAVSCSDALTGPGEIQQPVLIVEVLSPSTEATDRKRKLGDYRRLPSVQEIVLIDAAEMFCEVHRRTGEAWLTDLLLGADALLTLESVGVDLALGELYAGIPLDDAAQAG